MKIAGGAYIALYVCAIRGYTPITLKGFLLGYRVADIKGDVGATRERLVCCELCLQVLKEVLEYDLVVTPQVF